MTLACPAEQEIGGVDGSPTHWEFFAKDLCIAIPTP